MSTYSNCMVAIFKKWCSRVSMMAWPRCLLNKQTASQIILLCSRRYVSSAHAFKCRPRCCQIFLGTTYQNGEKHTKMTIKYTRIAIKYTKMPQNIPNGRKIVQMAVQYTNIVHCKSIFTRSRIFGLKICHLANPCRPVQGYIICDQLRNI
jgi:hypothetical protein